MVSQPRLRAKRHQSNFEICDLSSQGLSHLGRVKRTNIFNRNVWIAKLNPFDSCRYIYFGMFSTASHHRCDNDDLIWIGFYRLLKSWFQIGGLKFVEPEDHILLSCLLRIAGNINITWMKGIVFQSTRPGAHSRLQLFVAFS